MLFYLKRKRERERKKNIYSWRNYTIFILRIVDPPIILINLNQNDNIAWNPVPFIFLARLKSNVIK